jgi:PAS domain S-box-containing protein
MISSNDFFQLSPLPMWVVDVHTDRFVDVNEAAVRMFGYTRSKLLELSPADLNDEQEILRLKSILDVSVRATIFYKDVKAFVKNDGSYLIAELEQNQITYNNISCNLVLILDITLRVNNEISIRESNDRFDVLSKATSDTIWDYRIPTKAVVWNKGIRGVYGHKNIKSNTTEFTWFKDQIHPEDQEDVIQFAVDNLNKRLSRWKNEFRFRCADGSYKYVLSRNFVIYNADNKPMRIIGALEDISKRKEEEHWSKLLESVVINTTDGVIITNAAPGIQGAKILYVNTAFVQMTGYNKEELIGRTPRTFMQHEVNRPALIKLYRAVKKQLPCDIEVVDVNKSGQEYWVSMNVSPVTDSTGEVTHWISIQRDITESKRYLKAIEEQNKKLKEIAWIQSHVVRAPLARVMGLVELLKQQTPGEETDLLLQHLSSSAKDLDAIIIDIADRHLMANVS